MLCAACGYDRSWITKCEQVEGGIRRVRQCRTCRHVWRTRETEIRDKAQEGKAA